jgi:hypothetical protein
MLVHSFHVHVEEPAQQFFVPECVRREAEFHAEAARATPGRIVLVRDDGPRGGVR